MSDLISRQEVLNKLNVLDQQELYLPCHIKEFVIDEVSNIPPKVGRWISTYISTEEGYPYNYCSLCGFETGARCFWKYCPNCDADMRGGKNGI